MYAELDLPALMAGRASNDNPEPSRRRFPRRTADRCVLRLDEKSFPVQDWSRCGVLITADSREFSDAPVMAALTFHSGNEVIEIPVEMQLARGTDRMAAFNFLQVAADADRLFDQVIERSFVQAMQDVQAQF